MLHHLSHTPPTCSHSSYQINPHALVFSVMQMRCFFLLLPSAWQLKEPDHRHLAVKHKCINWHLWSKYASLKPYLVFWSKWFVWGWDCPVLQIFTVFPGLTHPVQLGYGLFNRVVESGMSEQTTLKYTGKGGFRNQSWEPVDQTILYDDIISFML